jgi:hypothetical protein
MIAMPFKLYSSFHVIVKDVSLISVRDEKYFEFISKKLNRKAVQTIV